MIKQCKKQWRHLWTRLHTSAFHFARENGIQRWLTDLCEWSDIFNRLLCTGPRFSTPGNWIVRRLTRLRINWSLKPRGTCVTRNNDRLTNTGTGQPPNRPTSSIRIYNTGSPESRHPPFSSVPFSVAFETRRVFRSWIFFLANIKKCYKVRISFAMFLTRFWAVWEERNRNATMVRWRIFHSIYSTNELYTQRCLSVPKNSV